MKDVKIPFVLEGTIRVDDTPVYQSIREALTNCLVNTDFYLSRGVVIKKDTETIVFENPGSIRTGKTQMLRGGISDPRNASIMKMLNLIGIGERAGSGVPDIFATWEQQGWKEPEVEEQYGPDRTILTLSFIKKVVVRSSSGDKSMDGEHVSTHETIHDIRYEAQVQRLIDFCSEPRSRSEMQEYLGLTNRSYFSKGYIMPLINSGKLKMTIPDKPRSRNQRYIRT